MLKRSKLLVGVLVVFSIVLSNFLTKSVGFSKPKQVTFALGPTGEFLQSSTTLVLATLLDNTSGRNAFEVQVESITLNSAPLLSPPLPLLVGEIDAGQSATVQVTFDSSQLVQEQPYQLVVHGSYRPVNKGTGDDEGHEFTVSDVLQLPPIAPGSAPVNTTSVGSNTVSGAPFPHQPPDMTDEVNEASPPVPTGPFVPGTPTPSSTSTAPVPPISAARMNRLRPDPPSVTFDLNQGLGLTAAGIGCNGIQPASCAEPSGAAEGGGVVFMSANWLAGFSTDGGHSFTVIDPTKVFPNDAVGYCCDQIVQYAPSIDRFIWLLQGSNFRGYRLATASPAQISSSGGTSWTYWNLTLALFPPDTGLDFPDMSIGNNSLYISWDANCSPNCNGGLQVLQIPLSQIQAGGTIDIGFTNPSVSNLAWGGKLSQDTLDQVFWAGHNGNGQLRVFSWPEGSGTYSWRDIAVSTWANNNLSSLTPDGQDWLAFAAGRHAVIGATRSANQVWFAWDAGTDDNFAQDHIEMVTLHINNNFNKIQQVQIWNPNYAFAYPTLATNACTGEVGISLQTGGNGNYENHAVGFWGDFVVYVTTNSNAGVNRYGDYSTIRQAPGQNGEFFDALGYGVNSSGGSGQQADVRYVVFGRGGACSTN